MKQTLIELISAFKCSVKLYRYKKYQSMCNCKAVFSLYFVPCVCMQVLKDWHLALGVLTLVLVDFTILLAYTVVEGVQGKHTVTLVRNRENPSGIEGVS